MIGCYQGVSIFDVITYGKDKGWVEPGELCELESLSSLWLLHTPSFTGLGVLEKDIQDVLEYDEVGQLYRVVSMTVILKNGNKASFSALDCLVEPNNEMSAPPMCAYSMAMLTAFVYILL